MQNFVKIWKNAKKINIYNEKLATILPPPLNQITLTHIENRTTYFIAKNSAILTLAKGG